MVEGFSLDLACTLVSVQVPLLNEASEATSALVGLISQMGQGMVDETLQFVEGYEL